MHQNPLEKGAAACVLIHNHPSGVKDQSHADELITKRVAAALALIEVVSLITSLPARKF